jgi:hypothetical protein
LQGEALIRIMYILFTLAAVTLIMICFSRK